MIIIKNPFLWMLLNQHENYYAFISHTAWMKHVYFTRSDNHKSLVWSASNLFKSAGLPSDPLVCKSGVWHPR